MSRIRRPAAVRNRPAPRMSAPPIAAAETQNPSQVASTSIEKSKEDLMREKVLAEFEESLKGQPGLDEAGMELLLSEFEKAIQSTPINLEAKPIDPDDIAKNLNDLVDAGILGEDDRNELARKFEGLNEPFDNKEVKVAIEFARRCEQEGQAAAYAWLEAQRSSVAESKFATQSGFEKIEGNHQVKRPRGRPNRTRGSPV